MKRNETKTALTGDELSVLCWQLGQLCRAGMSWSDSAALLAEDAPTPRSRALLAGLRDALAAGVPLDRALAEAGSSPPICCVWYPSAWPPGGRSRCWRP